MPAKRCGSWRQDARDRDKEVVVSTLLTMTTCVGAAGLAGEDETVYSCTDIRNKQVREGAGECRGRQESRTSCTSALA